MDNDSIPSDLSDNPNKGYGIHKIKISSKDKDNKPLIAIYYALAANLIMFFLKLIGGLLSNSSALLAEAAHSFADSFNSFCLLIGFKRGKKPADDLHPFGYGLETKAWTLIACVLMLFSSFVSLYWGYERIFHDHHTDELIKNFYINATILIIAHFVEVKAIMSASSAIISELKLEDKGGLGNFITSVKNIHNVKNPTTRFVWYEDTAAFLGVFVALISSLVGKFIMPIEYAYIPDAIASCIIGALLFFLAIYLFRNYLISLGASAKPQVEKIIKDTTLSINGISQIYDLKTMDMGSSGLIVNMEIEVDPETQVRDVDDITEKVQEKLRSKIPSISHINIEVQADETDENWGEKFETLIQEGIKQKVINFREAKILLNFYSFTETTVYEVMVPRTEIDCLEKSDNLQEMIDLVIKTGHTRIPIYDESIDNMLGVVHSKDLFKLVKSGGHLPNISLADLIREVPVVPENKSVSRMLHELITNKSQMALVVDEHGGISGLLTIEDLLEEIFGEIWDEYDVEKVERKRINEQTIILAAKLSIEEINERYDLDLPTEEFQTIGGYIFGQLGRLPRLKDEINVGDTTFIVESMTGRKMEYIKLFRSSGIVDIIEEEELKLERESYENEIE